MNKLTDLEICKRIAEIEFGKDSDNWFWSVEGESDTAMVSAFTGDGIFGSYSEYNPLTDHALCFKLMVNHYIEIGLYGTWYGCFKGDKPKGSDGCLSYELNINKAICLAIIEAHK